MTPRRTPYYHPASISLSDSTLVTVHDPCLTAFLASSSDDEAWRALDDLLNGDLAPVMREAVTRQMARSRWMAAHIEDVLAELRVKLTQKLWSLRGGAGEPIENLPAYCAIAGERTCYAFLRKQFPERTRLRNRIRYAVSHHPSTTIALDDVGIWRCRSHGIRLAAEPGSTRSLIDSPATYAADHGIDPETPLPALVATLLDSCDEPIELDRLVDAVASMLGISDASPIIPLERVVDPAVPITAVLEQRASLQEVWREVAALPLRQRIALLLNLRDSDGGATLPLLPSTDVVTMAAIAEALGVSDTELTALWADLPLDDLTIAARLGVSRQQVINLRKAARARLARRLGGNQTWLPKR